MRIGISNIAWPAGDQDAGLGLSRDLALTDIEIAPFAYFGSWDDAEQRAVDAKAVLRERGLRCTALQGFLHGVSGVDLFVSNETRTTLRSHLVLVAKVSAALGAKACVYGAPRLRDRGGLSSEEAFDIAVDFMRDVAAEFAVRGTTLAIEANARHYGCNFLTTTAEAAAFVRAVDHPGCRLQLDTGTIFIENEPPEVIADVIDLVAHAHISEPDLAPIGSAGVDHAPVAAALREAGYTGSLSIEMKAVADWRDAVTTAVSHARGIYQ